MSMPKFRKRPVVIEAEQFFIQKPLPFQVPYGVCHLSDEEGWHVHTPEGILHISEGDWIIRGVKGEFYPCKPDIFEATYEPI
jgi:hypothetical protein